MEPGVYGEQLGIIDSAELIRNIRYTREMNIVLGADIVSDEGRGTSSQPQLECSRQSNIAYLFLLLLLVAHDSDNRSNKRINE